MIGNLTKNWWAFALQGVLAIAVGVAAFIAVFAAYAVVTGVTALVAGLSTPNGPNWSLVLGGIAGIAIAAFTVAQPNNTALAVVLLVGIYAIATGVAQIGAAYTLGSLSNTWLLGLSGVISVAFGVLLIANPGTGVLAVLYLIGFYAIFAGIALIAFGLRLRGVNKDTSAFEAKIDQARNAVSGSASSTAGSDTSSGSAAAGS
jgi:uncharacterized membrane protein HdeD (DUF308 family)